MAGGGMTEQERIEAWLDQGGRVETDLECRLIARLPWVRARLEDRTTDPTRRVLMGMPCDAPAPAALRDRVGWARGGYPWSVADCARMEGEARDQEAISEWIHAARCHASASVAREAEARRALSAQELPYVFPGEVHPLMVDVWAAGEKILPALHVDWVRKLTDWMAPALALDCEHLGMWFWPVIRSLDAGRLKGPMTRLLTGRMSAGGMGLLTIYAERIGFGFPSINDTLQPLDRRIVALARLAVSQRA